MKIHEIQTGFCFTRKGHKDWYFKIDLFLYGRRHYQAVDLMTGDPVCSFRSPNLPQDDYEIIPRPWEAPASPTNGLVEWEIYFSTEGGREEFKLTLMSGQIFKNVRVIGEDHRGRWFFLLLQSTPSEKSEIQHYLHLLAQKKLAKDMDDIYCAIRPPEDDPMSEITIIEVDTSDGAPHPCIVTGKNECRHGDFIMCGCCDPLKPQCTHGKGCCTEPEPDTETTPTSGTPS